MDGVEIGLESISSQIGTAVLDVQDGRIVRSTGQLAGEDSRVVCATLFKILQDSLKCTGSEPLRRVSVAFNDFSYVMTVSDKLAYIVKLRP